MDGRIKMADLWSLTVMYKKISVTFSITADLHRWKIPLCLMTPCTNKADIQLVHLQPVLFCKWRTSLNLTSFNRISIMKKWPQKGNMNIIAYYGRAISCYWQLFNKLSDSNTTFEESKCGWNFIIIKFSSNVPFFCYRDVLY